MEQYNVYLTKDAAAFLLKHVWCKMVILMVFSWGRTKCGNDQLEVVASQRQQPLFGKGVDILNSFVLLISF